MEEYNELKNDISKITHFLSSRNFSSYEGHLSFLTSLHTSIVEAEYDLFLEKVNSPEFWGGSGSIWESEFGMSTNQRQEFEEMLLNLLSHLDQLNLMQKRAKSAFRVLIKNRTKD